MRLKRIKDNLTIREYQRAQKALEGGMKELLRQFLAIDSIEELQALAEAAYVVVDATQKRISGNLKEIADTYLGRAIDLGASSEDVAFMGVFLELVDQTGTPVIHEPLRLGFTVDFTLEKPEDVQDITMLLQDLGIKLQKVGATTVLSKGRSRIFFSKARYDLFYVGMAEDIALRESTGLDTAVLLSELAAVFIKNFIIKYADEPKEN